MLTEAKNNLKFILKSIIYNVSSAFEYKKAFIIQSIFMFVNNGFFLIFWIIVGKFDTSGVAQMSMNGIMTIWSIATLSWGLANFVFGGIREINRYIVTGTLDAYMLQPKNLFFSIATSKCSFASFGDLAYGFVLSFLVTNTFPQLLMIWFYSIIATILTITSITIIRSLAIWLGDIDDIAMNYEHHLLITLSIYPESIFDGVVKFIMYTVVPTAYMVHIPFRLLISFNWQSFVTVIIATILYVLLASFIFTNGMKKYESGNSMIMRG